MKCQEGPIPLSSALTERVLVVHAPSSHCWHIFTLLDEKDKGSKVRGRKEVT